MKYENHKNLVLVAEVLGQFPRQRVIYNIDESEQRELSGVFLLVDGFTNGVVAEANIALEQLPEAANILPSYIVDELSSTFSQDILNQIYQLVLLAVNLMEEINNSGDYTILDGLQLEGYGKIVATYNCEISSSSSS